ncbi:MAG: flavodoxin family protein [Firmicutes bacterium]|jgi:multimeric flavodoxin WrbA|nr:flavodoxin family protein [Bacillota bacterium]
MGPLVVGIVGSPRKNMNTDAIVSAALEGARSLGARTEKIYLDDLRIAPCRACGEFPRDRYCSVQDDMEVVYRALDESDAVVLGTPAYFGCVSAQVKAMIDRSNCLSEMLPTADGGATFVTRVAKGKRGLFVWVADLSTDVSHALATVSLWCSSANIDLVDCIAFTGSERPGAAEARRAVLGRAFEAGRKLAG